MNFIGAKTSTTCEIRVDPPIADQFELRSQFPLFLDAFACSSESLIAPIIKKERLHFVLLND